LYCEREYDRGAGCGKTARPDLYGGHWETGVPTMTVSKQGVTMKKLILISLAILFLQGCATTYQNDGFSGGYSETQLDENVFKVSFRGNGFTRRDKVADFTLLRSAELAIQNGYNYFVVIDANSYTSTSTHTTPTTTNTSASAYGTGNYAYGNATSTTTGGQTYNISKPSSSNTIICYKEKPSAGFSYNANFIYKSLAEKYGINDQDS
jgi:hypothetical protein